LDGKEFVVQVTTVTSSDHVMRVPGKGMPRRYSPGFGDLYLTFEGDFGEDGLKQQERRGGCGGGEQQQQQSGFGGRGGPRRGNQEQTTPSVEIPLF
jgi:DnaJ-class molecular chaperone